MNVSGQHPVTRLVGTAVIALLCGGFGWNIVGEQLLSAGTPVRWALWAVFAAFGGGAYWSKEPTVRPERKTVAAAAVVTFGAITAVVLLHQPANLYVAAAVLLVGGSLGLVFARRAS